MQYHSLLAAVLLASAAVAAEPPTTSPLGKVAKPPAPEPVPPAELEKAIKRGTEFLLKIQNEDGSWGTPERTKGLNIMASPPGAHHAFRAGTTGLCLSALIETDNGSTEVRNAIDRGEQWVIDNLPKLRRANPEELYNVWGHGYGVLALARMHQRYPHDKERQKKIEGLIRGQFELLTRFESVDGGWGYYDFRAGTKRPAADSTSFTTAAILVAFNEAKKVGVEPPSDLVKRATDSIVRQRKPDFTYLYGEYLKWSPMDDINRPGGSLGRSQACNLALRLWGDKKVTDEVLVNWLDRLIVRNGWLDHGRKRPIPHESRFAVAGYFYYFGHYYAAGCIELLPEKDRPFYQDHLARLLLPLQEQDGSWWDYPLYNYHQQYGTGFALMSLAGCRKKN